MALAFSARRRTPILLAVVAALGIPAVIQTAVAGADNAPVQSVRGSVAVPQLTASSVVDNFSGARGAAPNADIWQVQTGAGGWGSGELQNYTSSSSNVSLDGAGHLLLTAQRTGSPGSYSYTSGRIASWAMVGPTLHAEARIKMPAGFGTWPTFWLMGADANGAGWPVTGEIDVAEGLGRAPNSLYATAHGFTPDPTAKPNALHWQSSTILNMANPLSAGFHTFTLDVTANTMTWRVDGAVYKVLRSADLPTKDVWSFNVPFHVILSLAIGGSFGLPPKTTTTFPTSMVVDYVRVTGTGTSL